jgi:SAM-dependent methyltransferase
MPYTSHKPLDEIVLSDFFGSPRASSWIPRHADVVRIADYIKLVHKPRVIDAGCGNGFITRLLALEGLNILGVNIELSEEDVRRYSDIRGLELRQANAESIALYRGRNVVFNSWMPSGSDWSGCFKFLKPKPEMIIYVKSRSTGVQPGMPGNFNDWDTYQVGLPFVEADRWKCFGNDDFDSDKPRIASKIGEVIIQARGDLYEARRTDFERLKVEKTTARPYNWEAELPADLREL